jgi:hypothetical protein
MGDEHNYKHKFLVANEIRQQLVIKLNFYFLWGGGAKAKQKD